MNQEQERDLVVAMIRKLQRPGRNVDELDGSENLFDAGILDSLAILEIVTFLEEQRGLNLVGAGISAEDFSSIDSILGLMSRCGPKQ